MFAGFIECWVIVISVVGWWTGFWWHDCKSGDDQLNINCISGVYAAATGLLYCFLSPHDMKRLVVYCYFCMFVYLSVNLSIKSTKFGGGYLVNRLPELDKILHIDRPGLAVHQDWWILPKESHWNCTALLDKHLWNSRIWVDTQVRLYWFTAKWPLFL